MLFVSGYVKTAPDTAIIISGAGKRKILIGKAGFRWPFFQRIDKLSLRVFQVDIKKLVQDRQGVANSVKENVVLDMAKMGIEVVNFIIQSFSDDNHVIENLGIDNIAQISKDAAIAKANADRDVTIAKSAAEESALK